MTIEEKARTSDWGCQALTICSFLSISRPVGWARSGPAGTSVQGPQAGRQFLVFASDLLQPNAKGPDRLCGGDPAQFGGTIAIKGHSPTGGGLDVADGRGLHADNFLAAIRATSDRQN